MIRKYVLLLACSGFSLSMATAASAQSTTDDPAAAPAQAAAQAKAPTRAAPADGESSADVIVTARRTEERLQDVPISITVFSQQQIASRNIVNAGDLATYTPSLSVNPNYGTEYTSFAIRGFVQDPQTAPTVGVYFGDVVVPRGGAQSTQSGDGAGPGSLFDLQNVQVLKGPQGTLQGRNTTGGAVLLVPQKPTSKFEGYLEGGYGNYDMKRLQGVINIPLGENARLRIGGDYMSRDGYLKNDSGVGPTRFNDVNYYALRASLVVDLTPDLENYSIVSYTNSDTAGSTKKMIGCVPTSTFFNLGCKAQIDREAGTDFYTLQSAVPDAKSQLEQWQVINTTTWRASDNLTLKNIASYGQLTTFQRSSLFGTDWRFGIPALGIPVQQFGFTLINPAPGFKSADQYTMTEEFQIQGKLGDRFTYQAGAYLEVSQALGPNGFRSQTLIPCSSPDSLNCTDVYGIAFSAGSPPAPFANTIRVGSNSLTLGTMSYHDVGFYGQASYALTDKLKLTGGIRYTEDRNNASTTRVSYNFNPLPPFTGAPLARCTDNLAILYTGDNCLSVREQKSSAPTWLIDVDYKPTDDLLIYAKWSRGYRAGGINPQSPTSFRTFQQEKVDAYEGGVKATLRGAVQGTINVAAFYNDFSNQQLQAGFFAAPGAPVSSTAGPVNAGKSRIYGAEVDSSISPFHGFWIDASYAYVNASVRQITPIVNTDPNYTVSYQIKPGDPLLLTPRNKFSITARYTLPLSQDIGQITFGATVSHSDSYESTYAYLHTPVNFYFNSTTQSNRDLGRIPGVTLLNLNVDWKNVGGLPVDAAIFATNVTNKQYYTYTAGLGGAGFESANIGEPRLYGIRLRYHFGS
jgi:iron complex outermembrane receptor protein